MNILIIVAVITLCICNIVIVAAVAFLAYTYIHNLSPYIHRCKPGVKGKDATPQAPVVTPEEREKFQKEMDAFQELMGYNANVAYGISPKEDR